MAAAAPGRHSSRKSCAIAGGQVDLAAVRPALLDQLQPQPAGGPPHGQPEGDGQVADPVRLEPRPRGGTGVVAIRGRDVGVVRGIIGDQARAGRGPAVRPGGSRPTARGWARGGGIAARTSPTPSRPGSKVPGSGSDQAPGSADDQRRHDGSLVQRRRPMAIVVDHHLHGLLMRRAAGAAARSQSSPRGRTHTSPPSMRSTSSGIPTSRLM